MDDIDLEIEADRKANDRLRDAAPQLLAALQRLDLCTTKAHYDSHSPYFAFNDDDAAIIRAAIEKATH